MREILVADSSSRQVGVVGRGRGKREEIGNQKSMAMLCDVVLHRRGLCGDILLSLSRRDDIINHFIIILWGVASPPQLFTVFIFTLITSII